MEALPAVEFVLKEPYVLAQQHREAVTIVVHPPVLQVFRQVRQQEAALHVPTITAELQPEARVRILLLPEVAAVVAAESVVVAEAAAVQVVAAVVAVQVAADKREI